MTDEEQLELWCQGKSVHNDELGECCPDFSCCKPELAIPIEQRIIFRDRPECRSDMLGMFLGRLIATIPQKVHIIGDGGLHD